VVHYGYAFYATLQLHANNAVEGKSAIRKSPISRFSGWENLNKNLQCDVLTAALACLLTYNACVQLEQPWNAPVV
jgi:hypothetical protein